MLRPAITQIITKNESYYSLVIGVAKRAKFLRKSRLKLPLKSLQAESTRLSNTKSRKTKNKNDTATVCCQNSTGCCI